MTPASFKEKLMPGSAPASVIFAAVFGIIILWKVYLFGENNSIAGFTFSHFQATLLSDIIFSLVIVFLAYIAIREHRELQALKAADKELKSESSCIGSFESDLKAERNFLSAILQSSGSLIIVVDREGRIIRFNRACEQITGYKFEEVKKRPFWDFLLLSSEREQVRSLFDNLCSDKFPNSHENYWLTKSRERRLISWSNTALLDEEGKAQFIIGTGVDITDRRIAELGLERAERRSRELVENSLGLICTHDLDGRLLSINPAAANALGYSQEELVGRCLKDVIAPSKQHLYCVYLEWVRCEKTASGVMQVITKKGEERLWKYHNVLHEDEDGKYVLGHALDITEFKQAEREMKALFKTMNDLIFVIDKDGRYLKVVPTNPSLLFRPPAEIVGRKLSEVFPKEQAEYFLGFIRAALETKESQRTSYSLPINDVTYQFEGTITSMSEETVLFVARHISEDRQIRNASQEG